MWTRIGAVLLTVFLVASAQARTIRIVAFGDSATYGWLVKRDDSYPAQLEKMLRAKGRDVSVTNAGIPGDTTKGALARLDGSVPNGTDIVLVEFGVNDLRMHVPQKAMRGNLSELVQRLCKRGIGVLVIGLGGLDVSDVARANNVLYVQWKLPPGQYRARDNAHFNAEGYAILLARTLPQIERLIAERR